MILAGLYSGESTKVMFEYYPEGNNIQMDASVLYLMWMNYVNDDCRILKRFYFFLLFFEVVTN